MQVMDALVVSLAKWTVLLDPHAPKPSVAFGDNHKARLATESIFLLANRCDDQSALLCVLHFAGLSWVQRALIRALTRL